MKKLLILLVVLTSTTVTFAQNSKDTMPKGKTAMAVKKTYTCLMHPEVTSDKPGKCPKCGMDLVEKKPMKKSSTKGMKMDSTKH